MSESKIRVLIVDDHPLILRGLRGELAERPEVEIVGEAQDADGALEAAEGLEPDVVLMDIALAGGSGVEVTRRLVEADPDVRVIMLTTFDDDAHIQQAAGAGAHGYLVKSLDLDDLWKAIQTVVQGELYYPGRIAGALIRTCASRPGRDRRHHLAPRERQVVALIARGYPNKQIADQLSLSERTIQTYRERAMKKLDLHSASDLTRYALSEGLIEPDR